MPAPCAEAINDEMEKYQHINTFYGVKVLIYGDNTGRCTLTSLGPTSQGKRRRNRQPRLLWWTMRLSRLVGTVDINGV